MLQLVPFVIVAVLALFLWLKLQGGAASKSIDQFGKSAGKTVENAGYALEDASRLANMLNPFGFDRELTNALRSADETEVNGQISRALPAMVYGAATAGFCVLVKEDTSVFGALQAEGIHIFGVAEGYAFTMIDGRYFWWHPIVRNLVAATENEIMRISDDGTRRRIRGVDYFRDGLPNHKGGRVQYSQGYRMYRMFQAVCDAYGIPFGDGCVVSKPLGFSVRTSEGVYSPADQVVGSGDRRPAKRKIDGKDFQGISDLQGRRHALNLTKDPDLLVPFPQYPGASDRLLRMRYYIGAQFASVADMSEDQAKYVGPRMNPIDSAGRPLHKADNYFGIVMGSVGGEPQWPRPEEGILDCESWSASYGADGDAARFSKADYDKIIAAAKAVFAK
jgi:hypothetical protein